MAKKSIFEDGVTKLLREEMESLGFKLGNVNDSMEVLISYFTVCKRIVPPCHYRIVEAKGFSVPWNVKLGYWLLKWKLRHGMNITPHLHKAIQNAKAKDAMLFDWGIHHFHLGLFKKGRFMDRTGNVLYAIVEKGVVYSITINEHQHWFDKELLEIINSNWPYLLDSYRMPANTHLTLDVDTNFIKQFRKSNINAMIKLTDQSVIMGRGGGYSTDGTSAESVRWAISSRNILLKAENFIKDELKKDSECLLGITDLTYFYREGKDIVVSDNNKTKRYGIIEIPTITFKQ